MTRYPDWPERLAEFVKSRTASDFVWGENDCAMFCADAIKAITGDDVAKKWRGYSTASDAIRSVREAGGLHAIVTNTLGTPVSPLMAGRGDVVLANNHGRDVLGICYGHSIVGPGSGRLVLLPMSDAVQAWKV